MLRCPGFDYAAVVIDAMPVVPRVISWSEEIRVGTELPVEGRGKERS